MAYRILFYIIVLMRIIFIFMLSLFGLLYLTNSVSDLCFNSLVNCLFQRGFLSLREKIPKNLHFIIQKIVFQFPVFHKIAESTWSIFIIFITDSIPILLFDKDCRLLMINAIIHCLSKFSQFYTIICLF